MIDIFSKRLHVELWLEAPYEFVRDVAEMEAGVTAGRRHSVNRIAALHADDESVGHLSIDSIARSDCMRQQRRAQPEAARNLV